MSVQVLALPCFYFRVQLIQDGLEAHDGRVLVIQLGLFAGAVALTTAVFIAPKQIGKLPTFKEGTHWCATLACIAGEPLNSPLFCIFERGNNRRVVCVCVFDNGKF